MPRSRPDRPDPPDAPDPSASELTASFENETAALAHAITEACNGHDIRVVLATISTILAYALVQATRGPEGLDEYLAVLRADVHDLWRRQAQGLPLGDRVN